MRGKPLVTVISVFLNAEKFIDEAIASVFAQSYSRWELLLVDDGSTDRSTAIARRYAQRHPDKVRYLEHSGHRNRGISASQNLAINTAKGQYIAFLDSDDIWFPEKLAAQVFILNAQPEAAMVYGEPQYWYSWSENLENHRRDLIIQSGVQHDSLVRPPWLLVRFLRDAMPIPCPSDVMVRRHAALEIGAFEESFRRIFTDQVFYAKLGLRWPVFVAGQNWTRYRKHPDSAVAVAKKSGQLRRARLSYLNWLERYMDHHSITDPSVRDAIRNARFRCLVPGLFRLRPHVKYRALLINEWLRRLVRRLVPLAVYEVLRAQPSKRFGSRVE